MNLELKQKWIDALRSGKYKQGRELLKDNENHFCCLGVLCDVFDTNGWEINNNYLYKDQSNICELPYNMSKELELDYNKQNKLIIMNDEDRQNFLQIADYIENNL